MKVWFGTTTIEFKEYKKHYYAIRQHLIDAGCVFTDDWLGDHGEWIEKNRTANRQVTRGVRSLYQECMGAINIADAVVIEFSVPNFSSSHQITHALYRRKPTLVLRTKKDTTFADSYVEGIDSPFLIVRDYTLENYKDVIDEFLGYSKLEKGQNRYNVVLDRKHKYYLDWASQRYEKSRSKILRELIEEDLNRDGNYKKYLRGH
ncbi:hypothetical protein ACFL13_02885 [Patescibacteria group bacterium]